jgi:hypothetical protein
MFPFFNVIKSPSLFLGLSGPFGSSRTVCLPVSPFCPRIDLIVNADTIKIINSAIKKLFNRNSPAEKVPFIVIFFYLLSQIIISDCHNLFSYLGKD